jgi:hypothetical protein
VFDMRAAIAALLFILAIAADAQASHFRYATISHRPIMDDGGNPTGTVQFRVVTSWRRSYPTFGVVNVGDRVSVATFDFGDGDSLDISATVTSVSTVEDWFVAEAIIVHQYAPGTKTVLGQMNGCCRLSSLENSNDSSFLAGTTLSPWSANSSPGRHGSTGTARRTRRGWPARPAGTAGSAWPSR